MHLILHVGVAFQSVTTLGQYLYTYIRAPKIIHRVGTLPATGWIEIQGGCQGAFLLPQVLKGRSQLDNHVHQKRLQGSA